MTSSYEWRPHCWMCDDRGDVYFTPSISTHHHPGHIAQWTLVGEGFDSVVAGYHGIVCGIKDSSLYLRDGVSCMQPMGTKWAPHICDIVEVMVGKKCIVRKTSGGAWYYTILTAHSRHTGVLDWAVVESLIENQPPNSSSGNTLVYHYTVDNHDTLYGLTECGQVACCKLVEEEGEEPYWRTVAEPPPAPVLSTRTGKLVSWLSSMWRAPSNSNASNGGGSYCIKKVSAGRNSIWCLTEGHGEVWQLVVSKLKNTTKWNWVKTVLPLHKDEEILCFEACKSSVDGLYVVLREKGTCKMVSYSLNSEGSGRREVMYPSTCPCRTLAIACTVIVKPKLCCEDGSCSFCISSNNSMPMKRANEDHSFAPETKRPRFDYRSHLLNGIKFYFNDSFLTQRYDIRDQVPQVDMNEIMKKFHYSFLTEREVSRKS